MSGGERWDEVSGGSTSSSNSSDPWEVERTQSPQQDPRTGNPIDAAPIQGGRPVYGGDVGNNTRGMAPQLQAGAEQWNPAPPGYDPGRRGPRTGGPQGTYNPGTPNDYPYPVVGQNGQQNPIDAPPLPPGSRPDYGPSGTVPGPDGRPVVIQPGQPNQPGGDPGRWVPTEPPPGPGMPRPEQVIPGGQQPGRPGGNPAMSANDQAIENSLYARTTSKGVMGHGIFFGSTMGAAQYGLDKWIRSIEPESRAGWQNKVMNNWSPWERDLTRFNQLFSEADVAKRAADLTRATATQGLDDAVVEMTRLFGQAGNEAAKIDFMKTATASSVDEQVGKLFTAQEAAAAKTYLAKHVAMTEAETAANTAAGNWTKMQNALKNAESGAKFSWGGLGKNVGKGLGIGVAVAGGSAATDYLVDKYLFQNDVHEHGKISWGLDAVVIPALIMAPNKVLGPRGKVGGVAASLLVSSVLDNVAGKFLGTGPADARFSTAFRPNWFEVAAGTAAALAPTSGWKKVGLMGAAWLSGRGYNLVTDAVGLNQGNVGAELRDDMRSKWSDFDNGMNAGKFNKAVEAGRKMGVESEAALEADVKRYLIESGVGRVQPQQLAAWSQQMKQQGKDPVPLLAGAAVRAASVGEFRLETGSRLVTPNSKNAKHGAENRIMQDTDYDLGGEATTFLRQAGMWLWEAENFSKNNGGSADQVKDLADMRKRVDEQLARAYDGHDMDKAYNSFKDSIQTRHMDMYEFGPRLKQYVDGLRAGDPRFHAKMARDYALFCMGMADFMSDGKDNGKVPAPNRQNGLDATVMMRDAMKYLQMAQQLDPNSSDAKWLQQKAQQLGQQIGVAADNQTQNGFNNPFSIPNPRP